MAARDELPEPLRARLAELAAADRDALIAEARAEARAQVKAALRDAYAAALLDDAGGAATAREQTEDAGAAAHARDRTAAAPAAVPARGSTPAAVADAGDGWWVYCVVSAGHAVPDGVAGVASGAPRLVAAGGLAALASPVPLDEFGEAPLRETLNDLAWLERTVRAHETVLDAMLAGGAVVPMRVCTIYRDEAQVRAMLEDRGALFHDTLARLSGKSEWGVKIVADRTRLEQHAREQSDEARALAADAGGGSEGGAYLARKKLAAIVRDESDRILDEVVRETHARLEEWAAGSVILPAQSRELAGYRGDMVFNGAYLVEDDRLDTFAALLDDLRAQYASLGLALDLTGPWPAYNFAGASPESPVRG
jgi:hypothetical protein